MQRDALAPSPTLNEVVYERLARGVRALLTRIVALRTLTREDEDGDGVEDTVLDVARLRLGLHELEKLASELLYELETPGNELLLSELPADVPLAEALSQLVEATAERLALSSRIVFSGQERTLSDQLARLLYRITQEVLAHFEEHEGAHRLRFTLDYQETGIAIKIEDDGIPRGDEQFLPDKGGEVALPPPLLFTSPVADSESRSDQRMHRVRALIERVGGTLAVNGGIELGVQVHVRIPYTLSEKSIPAINRESEVGYTGERIRLLIVDSQAVSRAGLHRLLESYPDLEVVGEASDGVQAVSESAELSPQIVLIDAQLPEDQSLAAVRQLRQVNAETRVLLLATQENEMFLYEALRAGASGYILKDVVPDELARAVRALARGEVLVQPQVAARLLARFSDQLRGDEQVVETLTAREREVLQLLARGLRNKEIAARLFVSERTVSFHLANIYAKLHVSGRTEALSRALEQGLLKI